MAAARELEGKVAVITGGGRGLGEAIVRELAAAGVTAIVADIRPELVESVVKSVREAGLPVRAAVLDVTDEAAVIRMIDDVWGEFGRLDFLINNAAVDMTLPIEEISTRDWERIMKVNLYGPFLTSKFAMVKMKEQGRGHIVNIASTAAKRTWANASAYHASKWGLLGFSHALHAEARPNNIKLTAVVSGGMKTPFLLDRFPDIDPNNLQDPVNVARTVRFVLSQPDGTVIPEVMVLPMRETSWP